MFGDFVAYRGSLKSIEAPELLAQARDTRILRAFREEVKSRAGEDDPEIRISEPVNGAGFFDEESLATIVLFKSWVEIGEIKVPIASVDISGKPKLGRASELFFGSTRSHISFARFDNSFFISWSVVNRLKGDISSGELKDKIPNPSDNENARLLGILEDLSRYPKISPETVDFVLRPFDSVVRLLIERSG